MCKRSNLMNLIDERVRSDEAKPEGDLEAGCMAMAACGPAGGDTSEQVRRPTCGAKNREGRPCANKAMLGKRRCRFHGGLSTGPRTVEGRARIAAAQRRRWAKVPAAEVADPYREAEEEMAGDSFMTI